VANKRGTIAEEVRKHAGFSGKGFLRKGFYLRESPIYIETFFIKNND
jgi:hypothetical protein